MSLCGESSAAASGMGAEGIGVAVPHPAPGRCSASTASPTGDKEPPAQPGTGGLSTGTEPPGSDRR